MIEVQYECPKSVSRVIQISTSTLAKWRCSGKGPPFYKVENGRIRYVIDEVLEWMKEYRYPIFVY